MRTFTYPFLLTWISQLILWLVFADNVGFRELIIGAVGSGISTLFVIDFLSKTPERFQIKRSDLAQAVRVPYVLFRDTRTLLRATAMRLLGREIPSGIVAIPFDSGGNDAVSRGRRAVAITLLTLTPNTLVLGIARKDRILFFHTILPQPVPPFLMRLGAQIKGPQ